MVTEQFGETPTSFDATVVTAVPVGPATPTGSNGVRRRSSWSVSESLFSG